MSDTASSSQRGQVANAARGQRFGVTVAPRTIDDLAALARIFEATFEATGYPVEGPPALDYDSAAPTLVEYFSGTPSQELGGFVAVGDDDDATETTVEHRSSDRIVPTSLPQRKILGHVSLRQVGHQSLESRLWNAFTGRSPARTTPGTGDCLWGVSRLAIDPAIQKRGVGGRLMDYVENEARGAGKTLVLGVLDKDVAAIQMYERRGWIRIGQEEGFAGRDGRLWTMYYYGLSNGSLS